MIRPDIGLPDGSEVGIGLLIAIFALPIGYFFLNGSKEDNSSGGCFGLIFIGVGIVCLFPLLAWICAIGQVIIGIGIALFIILLIIGLISGKFK